VKKPRKIPNSPLLQKLLIKWEAEIGCQLCNTDLWQIASLYALNVLGSDHTGRIWCVETGSCILQYVGHGGSVNSIRFHPTQDVVVTSSGDQKVHLWKAQFSALNQEMLVCCSQTDATACHVEPLHSVVRWWMVKGWGCQADGWSLLAVVQCCAFPAVLWNWWLGDRISASASGVAGGACPPQEKLPALGWGCCQGFYNVSLAKCPLP